MKVHVVAPGLDAQSIADVDVYAAVGGARCTGTLCGGHAAWPAGSPTDVNDMIDAILTQIESEHPGCATTVPASVLCPSAATPTGCAAVDVCCPTGGCALACAGYGGPIDLGVDFAAAPRDMSPVDLARVD